VTGIRVVCLLGIGTRNAWKAFTNSKCGITKLSEPDYDKLPCKINALVPKGNASHELNIDSYFTKCAMYPATAYALIARGT